MATIKASHLFYDMAVYALSQCDLDRLECYQKSFKEDSSRRYYTSNEGFIRLRRIQYLLDEASGYSEEIVNNFGQIIKWLSDNDKEAVWFIRMALKEVQERQRVTRNKLELTYNSNAKTSRL